MGKKRPQKGEKSRSEGVNGEDIERRVGRTRVYKNLSLEKLIALERE